MQVTHRSRNFEVPVQAAENGGGAFPLPYIICFLIIGILNVDWASVDMVDQ